MYYVEKIGLFHQIFNLWFALTLQLSQNVVGTNKLDIANKSVGLLHDS